MLKPKIEMIRDGKPRVLLWWHKPDGTGGHIPIAMEFSDDIEPEMVERIKAMCERPINVREDGKPATAQAGSSKHFLALPTVLTRLGFRIRAF